MAYNKVSNKTQNRDIKYISKDYSTFKNQLIEFAKVYFPDVHNDFSESNPGTMFLEMAAYVGDVLSFYTDTQIQENFLTLAQDRESLYNLAYAMGYKPKSTSAAQAVLTISQLVPSINVGGSYIPDMTYALNIKENSTFTTNESDSSFFLTEDCNFNYSSSFSSITASVWNYDGSNNPEYYLLQKRTPSTSGNLKETTFTIGNATKFKTLSVFDRNIISIESIVDSENNIWYEVPYLAQDTIYEEVTNNASNDPDLQQYNHETPYLLKLKHVPKRFITRIKPNNVLEIQFGAGISDKVDEQIIPNPDNIGLGIKDGRSKLEQAYDPSNFLYTKAYGEAPANTTLTVTYRVGGGLKANVSSNSINRVGNLLQNYNVGTNAGMRNFVISTVTCVNEEPATGGGSGDTLEDLRLNTIASFSTQNRTVTREDYIIRALSMPPSLGNIAKAYITQDDQIAATSEDRIPNPLALNLYTLGYTGNKNLTNLNTATKTNLATYLEQHRMLTDAINIKNAFVVNFGVDFEITVFKNFNNQEVLLQCLTDLKDYFNIDKWQINQPIIINDVKNTIGAVRGVQTVEDVRFGNKSGASSGYSQYRYPFGAATRNNVIYPSRDPSIFEIKYPNIDIRGQITTY